MTGPREQSLLNDLGLLQFGHFRMAREGSVPDHQDTGRVRLQNDRVQVRPVVDLFRPKISFESKNDARKSKVQHTAWSKVLQANLLASFEELWRLLVRRRALVETIIKIFRKQRCAIRLPFGITGPSQLDSWRPMAGNRAEARGPWFAPQTAHSGSGLLNVGRPLPDQVPGRTNPAGPDRVAPVPSVLLRALRLQVRPPKRAFVGYRHFEEWGRPCQPHAKQAPF